MTFSSLTEVRCLFGDIYDNIKAAGGELKRDVSETVADTIDLADDVLESAGDATDAIIHQGDAVFDLAATGTKAIGAHVAGGLGLIASGAGEFLTNTADESRTGLLDPVLRPVGQGLTDFGTSMEQHSDSLLKSADKSKQSFIDNQLQVGAELMDSGESIVRAGKQASLIGYDVVDTVYSPLHVLINGKDSIHYGPHSQGEQFQDRLRDDQQKSRDNRVYMTEDQPAWRRVIAVAPASVYPPIVNSSLKAAKPIGQHATKVLADTVAQLI